MQAHVFNQALRGKPEEVTEIALGLRSGNEITGELVEPPPESTDLVVLRDKKGQTCIMAIEDVEYMLYAAKRPPGQANKPQPRPRGV